MGTSASILHNPNRIIPLKSIEFPYKRIDQEINAASPADNLQLITEIDLNVCKDFKIGPYFDEENMSVMSEKYNDNNAKILKELLKLSDIYYYCKDGSVDFYNFMYSSHVLRIIDVQNLNRSIFFCPSMIFRIILYSIKFSQNPIKQYYIPSLKPYYNISHVSYLRRQINADIQRTNFLSSNLVMEYSQIFLENLGRILFETGLRDEEISYVQGFNFIVAFLLLITGNNLRLSFVIFVKILHMKSEYFGLELRAAFSQNFPLSENYKVLLKELLTRYDFALFTHLMTVDSSLFWVDKWIHTLFVLNFSLRITVKFWDFFIAEGIDTIILIIFLVLIYLKKDIMHCKELENFMCIIDSLKNCSREKEEDLFGFVADNLVNKTYKLTENMCVMNISNGKKIKGKE